MNVPPPAARAASSTARMSAYMPRRLAFVMCHLGPSNYHRTVRVYKEICVRPVTAARHLNIYFGTGANVLSCRDQYKLRKLSIIKLYSLGRLNSHSFCLKNVHGI